MGKRKHDIERYLRGEMSSAEMHALEKEALKDPFLSEALEGIDQAGHESFLFDLREMHRSVYQRTRMRRQKIISMWNWSLGIAAGLIFIAISAVFIISSLLEEKREPVAFADELKEEQPEKSKAPADTAQGPVTPAVADTASAFSAARHEQPQTSTAAREVEERAPADVPALRPTDDGGALALEQTVAEAAQPETLPERIASGTTADNVTRPADSTRRLEGRVTSAEDNTPLPGVNVRVEGTSLATVTDASGFYQLSVPSSGSAVAFTFVGMEEVEVSPGDKKVIDVQLSPDLSKLSEVVVIGYGAAGDSAREFAEPRGGKEAFTEYLAKELRYPEQALQNEVEGRVTIEFTVGVDGHLHEFQVLKGLGHGCDDEAIRLVREGPAWTPARRDAQPVPEKVKLRLKFAIPKKK